MAKQKVFVGIGCGAVQLGLWAFYARKHNCRVVLARVNAKKVQDLRKNKGYYSINIAHDDRIETLRVGPIEVFDLNTKEDREQVVNAIKIADDIVTAVPSTALYSSGGVADLLREGLKDRKTPIRIYASENQIRAAKSLEKLVGPLGSNSRAEYLDTVISRMGGLQDVSCLAKEHIKLGPITPFDPQAILVENFDKIILERSRDNENEIVFSEFLQSDNIVMHEEIKLYGHNAVHFLLGHLAALEGNVYMSELANNEEILKFGLEALTQETGPWFQKKYHAADEEIATAKGFEGWAQEIIKRVVNPFLYDKVERVIRDPERKLRSDDRIVGTITRALEANRIPHHYLFGLYVAARSLLDKGCFDEGCEEYLKNLWNGKLAPRFISEIIDRLKELEKQPPLKLLPAFKSALAKVEIN